MGKLHARCGDLQVPEDWEKPRGRKIPIHFVVIPATGRSSGAMFEFAGGPGVAPTSGAESMAQIFAFALKDRDFVLVDQRGTGQSNPLDCGDAPKDAPLSATFQTLAQRAQECLPHLRERADLRQYHAVNSIRDFEALRAALKYDKIDVHGLSYGSRLAQYYAREYPQHVRTLLLEGPLAIGEHVPEHFARDADGVLRALFAQCAADIACHTAFPQLEAEFQKVLAAFDQPRRIKLTNPATKGEEEVTVSRVELTEAVRYMLYNPIDSAKLPQFIDRVAGGDWQAAGNEALRRGRVNQVSLGMWFSVTCAEDVDLIPPTAEVEADKTYFSGDRIRQQRAACAIWPHARLDPQWLTRQPNSHVPALIVAGAMDAVTPPALSRIISAHFPGSKMIEIPEGTHNVEGMEHLECLDQIERSFLRSDGPQEVAISCLSEMKRPPFVTK